MDVSTFKNLLLLVSPMIIKKDTNVREAISLLFSYLYYDNLYAWCCIDMAFLHTNQAKQQCFPESTLPFFNHNNLIKLILHSSGVS